MRARKENLRSARLPAHVVDESANAVAVAEGFPRQHFVAAHDRLAATEIDDHVAVLDALDDAVDDIADAVLVFLILAITFGLAHFLYDHLLGRLRGDAAVFERRQGLGDIVADLGRGVALFRVLERDVRRVVFDLVHDQQQAREPHLAGLWIDLGADLGLATVARARRLLDGILHGGNDDAAVDRLFARYRVGNLQQFEPVGADGHRSFSFVAGDIRPVRAFAIGRRTLALRSPSSVLCCLCSVVGIMPLARRTFRRLAAHEDTDYNR